MAGAAPVTHRRPDLQTLDAGGGARWWHLGLDDLYLAVVMVVVLVRGLTTTIAPTDFWFHLATGRLITTTGSIPTVDTFSFTRAGEPFFNQSWLSQVLFHRLYEAGGLELVIVAHAVTVGAAFAVLLRLCHELGASKRLAAALTALVAVPWLLTDSFVYLSVRPQTYALPLFALALWATWGARQRSLARTTAALRRLWIVPPLVVLWTNVHGSFPLALAVVAAVLVGEQFGRRRHAPAPPVAFDRRLAAVGVVSALATLANPAGWRVWPYVAELGLSPVIVDVASEWQSPTLREPTGAVFFLTAVAVAVVLGVARRRAEPAELLLVAGFFLLGALAVRNAVWFGCVAVLLLARVAAGRLPDRPNGAPGARRANVALAAALVVCTLVAVPWVRAAVGPPEWGRLHGRHTPVAAVEALRGLDAPPSRLFHELGYGSYLTWAWPDGRVFIDPRLELYENEQFIDYIALSAGYDVERLLAAHAIDGVLADRELQRGLVSALRAEPTWQVAFEDETATLLLLRDD